MKLSRFLTDDKGEPSSTRLGLFLTIALLGAAMILCAYNKDAQAGVIAVALAGLAGGVFGVGKVSQDSVTKTQMKMSDPPPKPPKETPKE